MTSRSRKPSQPHASRSLLRVKATQSLVSTAPCRTQLQVLVFMAALSRKAQETPGQQVCQGFTLHTWASHEGATGGLSHSWPGSPTSCPSVACPSWHRHSRNKRSSSPPLPSTGRENQCTKPPNTQSRPLGGRKSTCGFRAGDWGGVLLMGTAFLLGDENALEHSGDSHTPL